MNKLLFLLVFLAVIIFSYVLQTVIVQNREELALWLSRFGPYVIFVYIILQALTTIIAPLGGFFLVVVMIALFGPGIALTLAYLVTTPCYLVNFYLSRRFGRPFAQRVIGKNALEKLDHYVKDAGTTLLILTRLLQGGNFDYLSYAWGLTKVPLKTFALVNILAGIPATAINYFIFTSYKKTQEIQLRMYQRSARAKKWYS